MAYEGALLTAAATLAASGAFLLAARATAPARSRRPTRDISVFFWVSSVFLLLAAVRQVFGYAGEVEADRVVFYVLVVPAALAVLPLGHMTMQLLGARRSVQVGVTGALWVLVALLLYAFYLGGIAGPERSFWGTEWMIRSPVARIGLVFVIVLPASFAGVMVWFAGRHLQGGDAQRLRRVGVAILVYYVAFLLDALALPGAFLVVERLVTAGAAWATWRAYRTAPSG